MLVLSRHVEETIDIGGGLITLRVVEIRGNKVRIGITAPKDLAVHRSEVLLRIAQETANQEAPPCEQLSDARDRKSA